MTRVPVRPAELPFPWKWDRSRYPDVLLLSHLSEATVQAQVLRGLHELGIAAWPVDVGGKTVRGRAFGALKRAGVKDATSVLRPSHPGGGDGTPGFVDVPGVLPGGRALFLEVKAPAWYSLSRARPGALVKDRDAGEPSDAQLDFLWEAHCHGAVVGLVWSLRDAISIVSPFLGGL